MSIRIAGYRRRKSAGYALIVALALVMGLTVVVAYTQSQVVGQLKLTKSQRDNERALQLAEAGANAYLNMMVNGVPNQGVTNGALIPSQTVLGSILSIPDFKQQAKDGTIPADKLIHYPIGNPTQGYYAAQIGQSPTTAQVVAYGWSNGIVRRVQLKAINLGLFDWAALYGLDANPSEYSIFVNFTVNIIGTVGAEGILQKSGPNEKFFIYDGPLIWAKNSFGMGSYNIDYPIWQSGPGTPAGHVGTGNLANPGYLHYATSLNVPTVDGVANTYSGSSQGAEYFRTHNDNATGLRLLVKTSTGAIKELPGNYNVVPTSGPNAYKFTWPDRNFYITNGMASSGEEAYGVRVYPGNYYFDQVSLNYTYAPGNPKLDPMYTTYGNRGPALSLRTFTDAERGGIPSGQRQLNVQNDPVNPNPGQSANQNIRVFMGHAPSGPDLASTMPCMVNNGAQGLTGTVMEYTNWHSRFRVYDASNAPLTIQSSVNNLTTPQPFYGGLMVYNKTNAGVPYGMLKCVNSTYLRGAAMGYQVNLNGKGCTFEKGTNEVAQEDRIALVVTQWSELP